MMRYLIPLLLLSLTGCASSGTPQLYHQMDQVDVQLANQALAQALETRTKGQSLTWFNPANRHSGSITPLRTFRHTSGEWCRDYREQLYIGKASQQWQDTVCRNQDGRWRPLRT